MGETAPALRERTQQRTRSSSGSPRHGFTWQPSGGSSGPNQPIDIPHGGHAQENEMQVAVRDLARGGGVGQRENEPMLAVLVGSENLQPLEVLQEVLYDGHRAPGAGTVQHRGLRRRCGRPCPDVSRRAVTDGTGNTTTRTPHFAGLPTIWRASENRRILCLYGYINVGGTSK